MTEDVVDFAPAGGRRKQSFRRDSPSWLHGGVTLPLAALGAALGSASCVGEWQSMRVPDQILRGQVVSSPVTAAGSLGTIYLATFVLLVTATALAIFGDTAVRGTARVAGLALSGCALVLLGASANLLSKTNQRADFQFLPAELFEDVTFRLEWGIYAAFAGVLALGVALALSRHPVAGAKPAELVEEPQFADDAMDLTVSVHPITR